MKTTFLAVVGLLGLVALSAAESPIFPAIKGQLVSSKGNQVVPFDDSSLASVKYFAIYYSASWCPPCRAFTPKLVEWYNRKKPTSPQFELILVGDDRSASAMAKYMADDQMKWPALDFNRKSSNSVLTGYAGSGIPDLVFVNANGKILSDSFVGGNYVGPEKVLADIEKTLHAHPASTDEVAAGKKPGGDSFDDFFKKKPGAPAAPAPLGGN